MSTKKLIKLASYFEKKLAQYQAQSYSNLINFFAKKMYEAQQHFDGIKKTEDVKNLNSNAETLKKIMQDYANGLWRSLSNEDRTILAKQNVTPYMSSIYIITTDANTQAKAKNFYKPQFTFSNNGITVQLVPMNQSQPIS